MAITEQNGPRACLNGSLADKECLNYVNYDVVADCGVNKRYTYTKKFSLKINVKLYCRKTQNQILTLKIKLKNVPRY